MHRNPKFKIIGISALLFVLSASSLWYFLYMRPNHAKTAPDSSDPDTQKAQIDISTVFTATGVTIAGMDTIILPTDIFGNITLYVEEVYHTVGDTVASGEKYIKFTDDSIDNARTALEKAVQDTDLAYRSKAVSNGEDSIQARYAYDMAMLEAEFAPQLYQDTVTQLEMQLTRTENAYQQALEKYHAYLAAVESNTFYDDFQIDQFKKSYYDAYDLYANRQKYWQMSEEELNALSASGRDDYQWILKTLALLREESEESRAEYELAMQNYQSEIEHAEFRLHKLLNQMERAEQDYTDAQLALQKEGLHAKTTFELSIARGNIAENYYNACLASLANELSQLGDAKERALKSQTAFEKLIGDGYLYTQTPGTIAMLPVKKGQALTGGDSILAYANAGKLFVSVSVPADRSATLSTGETASVTILDYGSSDDISYDAVIEMIQPVSDEYSTIMVSLKGDISALSSNLTAEVAFIPSDSGTHDTGSSAKSNDTDTNYLEIAEKYAAAGQQLKRNDPMCQFTQDSIENVRKTLVYEQSEASIALEQAQADYHIGVLEAGLSHNEALLDMTLAQSTYDNTIAKLSSGITAKLLETEQLLTDIYQLQRALTDDTYQKQQSEITKAYNSAKKQMEQARESFVTKQVEAAQFFQTARESYETFIHQFRTSDQQIQEKTARVYALQDEIFQDQQRMEKELITAQQTLSSSQTAGEIAQAKYTDSVKKYESAVNTAQARLEQTTQMLKAFDQFVGDGIAYAAENGLVTDIEYRKDDNIAAPDIRTEDNTSTAEPAAKQTLDLGIGALKDATAPRLQVAEILVTPGQRVQSGTPLIRLTAESVKTIRTTLQKEILDASKAYELLSAEQKELRLQVSQTFENYLADGKYSNTVYNNRCVELQKKTAVAKENVDNLQNEVNENLLKLTQLQQNLVAAQQYLKEAETAVSENYKGRYQNAYYYSVYENTRETAQNMVTQLEDQIKLHTEKNEAFLYEVDEAVRAYHQSVLEQEKEKLTAQLNRDTEIYHSEIAAEWRDIQTAGLDNALRQAKTHYETALQNIRDFDAHIVRNRILSMHSGIISDIMVEPGDGVMQYDTLVIFASPTQAQP